MKVYRSYQQGEGGQEALLVIANGKKAMLDGEEITMGEALEFMATQAHHGNRCKKWEE